MDYNNAYNYLEQFLLQDTRPPSAPPPTPIYQPQFPLPVAPAQHPAIFTTTTTTTQQLPPYGILPPTQLPAFHYPSPTAQQPPFPPSTVQLPPYHLPAHTIQMISPVANQLPLQPIPGQPPPPSVYPQPMRVQV